ncbi:bone morphogenetic protein 10-like [Takifugu rubripes]|uniref:bone morphogenetic protein 10-like n=1 Tax=Takifugu rubripes TaxID=31033 RepID=UPI001145684B|nr:bone morphogenetic protein 10-like [Takifugu rubripes]
MSLSICSILRLDVPLLLLLLLTLLCLGSCSPISPHRPAAENPLLDARDFLSHFLSTMNLTDRRPQQGPLAAHHREPTEYMLELYWRFTQDYTAAPSAGVVRSFKNEDSSPRSVTAGGVRRHPLLFNASMLHHEHITVAELHLFTLVRRAQRPSSGANCKVTIYRRPEGGVQTREAGKEGRRRGEEEVGEMQGLEELMTQQIYAKDNSWVSFDLTHVVALWLRSGCSAHRLEVHITAEEEGATPEVTEVGGDPAEVDIDRSLEGKHNAAIIVFSDDQSRDHKLDKQELQQMMEHEDDLWSQVSRHHGDGRDEQPHLWSSFVYDTPPRVRRSARSEPCKRRPLFVDFKDIGWDTWIIQPLGYEAYECKGACNPPMTSEVSPTKHAIVQSLLSAKSPKRASRACCVPTKLEPISLLYHENGVVTFKHKYEGMVVAECGCR